MAKRHRYFQLSQARNAGGVPPIPKEILEGRPMRLNKYLAHAGVGNRRAAENYIKAGQVKVNRELIKNPGHPVLPTDEISYLDKPLTARPGLAYVLLNRAAGLEEESLGDLIRHPELPALKWQSIFPRSAAIAGLSLLTNDEMLVKALRTDNGQVASLIARKTTAVHFDIEVLKLILKQLNTASSGLEIKVEQRIDNNGLVRISTAALSELEPLVSKCADEDIALDLIQLLQFDKRDLPRGFYRFLQPAEVRGLRQLI